jgi:hypothetical protein
MTTVAAAQTSVATPASTVRVTKDRSVIWRLESSAALTVVKAGTELEVVARRGDWYEVIVPPSGSATAGTHGLIGVNQAQLVSGPVPPNLAPRSRPARSTRGAAQGSTRAGARPKIPNKEHAGLRGFGEVGYGWLQAHQTYRAVFDRPGIPWVGAGAEYHVGTGSFVQGAFRRFRDTGERVFVLGDDVIKAGIADTVTITPVDVTIGYRVIRGHRASYIGAGVGRYFYKESFEFADPAEKVKGTFTSYHVMGGYERRLSAWVAAAFEAQYTHVPDALSGKLAETFKEHNLGGVELRVRFAIGR